MRIRRELIRWPCLDGSMQLVTATHRAKIPPSLHLSMPPRYQEIATPSHHPTLPPATPSHRATCHHHAATVYLCQLVRHPTVPPAMMMRNRVAVTPGTPSCRRAADAQLLQHMTVAIMTRHIWHIGKPPYTNAPVILHHAPDTIKSYLCSVTRLTQFHHMVYC